ncbi:MAG: putative CheY-like chemosensory protein [Anaerocolumna sp.]|nr:putative CheY-like chemosensory protein [Anaerocolumna sp.]
MMKDTVLIVDDSKIICSIIKDILVSPELHIETAHSGEECIKLSQIIHPTLILLDVIMNGMDGYETCRILKANEMTKDIPIIFITGNIDSDSVLKGFEVGAADYVSKPFIPEELKARVRVHMQNIKIQKELKVLMEELKVLATTDSLTRLYNRRYFMDRLFEYVGKDEEPFSLILFDIDDFKKVNDTYGHNAGDTVLITISNIFKLLLRQEDVISRWGGEEFMICLPGQSIEQAFTVAERLRNEIGNYTFVWDDITFRCTITGGVLQYDRELSTEKNITKTDKALYLGKTTGKNHCILAY